MATEFLVKDLSGVCGDWTSDWDCFQDAAIDMAEAVSEKLGGKDVTVTSEVCDLSTGETWVFQVFCFDQVNFLVQRSERKWG